jgi:hypothetical protein
LRTSTCSRSIRSRSRRAVALGALGRRDQFEEFVRIIEQIRKLVLILAHRCDRQLRGHTGFLKPRIRGHKTNFIDADSMCAGKGGF